MLGWHVSVYRKTRAPRRAAKSGSRTGDLLAQWQGGLGALSWLDELVLAGDAIDLGGDGYSKRYTVRCEHLRPTLLDGPPGAHQPWVIGEGHVIDPALRKGRTHLATEALASVRPEEWLIVETWDES